MPALPVRADDRPILLLGSNGQVGHALTHVLSARGPVVAVNRAQCDLADTDAVRALVRQVAPGTIVNAAAYTAVDAAEDAPLAAQRINAVLPACLADEARALDAWLLHYSTDYVFDGRAGRPYREDDPPAPCNVYGRTKHEGDLAVQAWPRHLLLRVSWVFGAHGSNFLKTILRLAQTREQLAVVHDQRGIPTSAAWISEVSAQALAVVQAGRAPAGLYHVASAGEASWHDYACYVVAEAARLGFALRCTPQQVQPIAAAAWPSRAPRPLDTRLDTHRWQTGFGVQPPSWHSQVTHVLQALASH